MSDHAFLLNDVIDRKDAPIIYEKIGARFKHILVDEFQDTSLFQWNTVGKGGLIDMITQFDLNTDIVIFERIEDIIDAVISNEVDGAALGRITVEDAINKFNIKTEKFSFYSEKDGLSNNVVYGVLAGDDDDLWMSTNKGISSFNRKTELFRNFHESDGLQSNEFNTGAYYKDDSGKMYFGGVNGFNSFYPEDISINKIKATPIITKFYLFNKLVKVNIKMGKT